MYKQNAALEMYVSIDFIKHSSLEENIVRNQQIIQMTHMFSFKANRILLLWKS